MNTLPASALPKSALPEKMTAAQFNARHGHKKPAPVATSVKAIALNPGRHAMNKGEAAYAAWLESQKQRGFIRAWVWQPMKLRLGSDWLTTLTPDFLVLRNDMTFEFVDVKGRKGSGFWAEEDAMVKLKVAAEKYPWFEVVIVWPNKDGTWRRKLL